MMPKVETFEHNIAEEIKMKEASLTEISAASNNVGNDPIELPKKTPVFFIALVTFFILCLLGFGMLGYFYFTSLTPSQTQVSTPTSTIPKVSSDITTLSPTLSNQIGRFVTRVDKKEQGYILTINSYSSVFAYMTRNESSYIEELASVFAGTPLVASSSTQEAATATPVSIPIATTTQIATTTTLVTATGTPKTATSTGIKTATSTKTTVSTSTLSTTTTITPNTPPVITQPIPTKGIVSLEPNSSFSDITIANQNMRIWTSGKITVVYAFVGNNTVLISNSKEGILALKGAILK